MFPACPHDFIFIHTYAYPTPPPPRKVICPGSCREAEITSPLLVVAGDGVSASGVAASLLAWQVEQGLICEAQAVSGGREACPATWSDDAQLTGSEAMKPTQLIAPF